MSFADKADSNNMLILALLATSVLVNPSLGLDVSGNWSDWGTLTSPCNASCGGGSKTMYRTCSNPSPVGNGEKCTTTEGKADIVEKLIVSCNNILCSSTWSDWGPCDKECGRGRRLRNTVCGDKKEPCTGNQFKQEQMPCNTWNKDKCPGPCETSSCPSRGVCRDVSNATDPVYYCECLLGTVLSPERDACIEPEPVSPTPRPNPTLPPAQKKAAVIITKTASTVLLIFLSIVLLLFILLRIFTPDRIIQMNMEIALMLAHIILLFPPAFDDVNICRCVSIFLHFFFTACFMFIFLEAIHMYSFVAHVVRKRGILTAFQNTLIGWGMSGFIVLVSMAFHFEDYGGPYQCWLMMDRKVMLAEVIPIISIALLTLIVIEAAGSAEYTPLERMNKKELLSAKISQRTNLILMPIILASWFIGVMSEYEQNLALYGIFSILNGVIGACILIFHCMGNYKVRNMSKNFIKTCCCKLKRRKI